MPIDALQKRWIIVSATAATVALAVYGWNLDAHPQGRTGGSIFGLWYGLVGSLLMVFAGLLAARRKLLRWRYAPSARWLLQGHVCLGLLSVVFLLGHSGFHWGGPLTKILWTVYGLTLVTGMAGLAMQKLLPRFWTSLAIEEMPYEQIPHACRLLQRHADRLLVEMCGAQHSLEEGAAPLREFFVRLARPYLAERYLRSSPLARPLEAQALFDSLKPQAGFDGVRSQFAELEHLCRRRRHLHYLANLHWWTNGWLVIHVPLALALLVLGLAHAAVALYY
ncbi:MAG: hypothetical protein HY040_22255 [Planctomycetes bacterium]|nr:hypothetical protein [Planctomycetota bacterium]